MSYALISVSDKSGIEDLAKKLVEKGLKLLSTGGTAKHLSQAGFPVTSIEEITGFPEILGGRVKTLNPHILGPILARWDESSHLEEIAHHKLVHIPVVVVNLYPFEEVTQKGKVLEEEALENIDIGGVTLLRSASKNYKNIVVISDPSDYSLAEQWTELSLEDRRRLALKAWQRVLEYDFAIFRFFSDSYEKRKIHYCLWEEGEVLTYGENPHQKARVLREIERGENKNLYHEISNKSLSYNNHLDISSGLFVVSHLEKPSCVVVKHTNPCGVAQSEKLEEAMKMAWQGDSRSAYGGIVLVNRPLEKEHISFFKGKFIEILCAPGFGNQFLEAFAEARFRMVQYKPKSLQQYYLEKGSYKSIAGGFLWQEHDFSWTEEWRCVTKRSFPQELMELAKLGVIACKSLTSNAISLVSQWQDIFWQSGMGAGQPNRVGALENLAIPLFARNCKELSEWGAGSIETVKKNLLEKTVLVSDGFFPFADSVERAAKFGIQYVVQPGGSKRDGEVIAACDELDVSMLLTGVRHFRHG